MCNRIKDKTLLSVFPRSAIIVTLNTGLYLTGLSAGSSPFEDVTRYKYELKIAIYKTHEY